MNIAPIAMQITPKSSHLHPSKAMNKPLSTSANALNMIDITKSISNQLVTQQPLSPPYYHVQIIKPPPTFQRSSEIPSAFSPPPSRHNESSPQVRRTASSVSRLTHNASPEIHVESPKNMTVVQQAKFQPYKEVTKPFEMSDFYKYSTKFRQKTASVVPAHEQNSSPQLPPKNLTNKHMHTASLAPTPTIYSVHNQ